MFVPPVSMIQSLVMYRYEPVLDVSSSTKSKYLKEKEKEKEKEEKKT